MKESISAVSLERYLGNNYQENYLGIPENICQQFREECGRRDCEWGHLFNAKTGELLESYFANKEKI